MPIDCLCFVDKSLDLSGLMRQFIYSMDQQTLAAGQIPPATYLCKETYYNTAVPTQLLSADAFALNSRVVQLQQRLSDPPHLRLTLLGPSQKCILALGQRTERKLPVSGWPRGAS